MNLILPLFLMLLSLTGGCVATYFIMDGPRRRAKERLEKLDRRLSAVEIEREDVERREQKVNALAAQLQLATTQLNGREWALGTRQQEFDRRAVTYSDLEHENRLLRVELRNAAVHSAYLEHLRQTDRAGQTSAADQRDAMGRAYFEEVTSSARKAMTASNLPQNNQRVRTAAERVRTAGVDLTPRDEQDALALLRAQYEKAVRAQEEREHQAQLREQIREEQRREREIAEAEEAAKQAERERAAVEAELARARAEAARQAAEAMGRENEEMAARHAETIQALQMKLVEAEARSQRAISNAQLTKKGCVYVISNIGSFGDAVFKIGMTRRSDPMDRVKELGDASVPFPFDVHMQIKCDDAPALENALHREFHHCRLNRVNPRKEFFRVPMNEIVAAVERHHGTVEYVADAEAIEFRNSLMATDADLQEIDDTFDVDDQTNRDETAG